MDRPAGKFGEDVAEIGADVEFEAATGFQDRHDCRHAGTGQFAADVQPVFAAQGHGPDGVLTPVVVDFYLSVFEEHEQAAPLVQGVIAGVASGAFGKNPLTDFNDPEGVIIAGKGFGANGFLHRRPLPVPTRQGSAR